MGTRINEIVAGVGQTNIAPVTPYEAVIANTATAYPQDVFVTIPSIDQGRTLKGAVRWTPLVGPNGELIFPTKDDIASVIRTQEGYYWVTNFIPRVFPALIVPPVTESVTAFPTASGQLDVAIPAGANLVTLEYEFELPSTITCTLQPNGDATSTINDYTYSSSTTVPNVINNPTTTAQSFLPGLFLSGGIGAAGQNRLVGVARVVTRNYSGRTILESDTVYTSVIGSSNAYLLCLRAAMTYDIVAAITFLRFKLTSGNFNGGTVRAKFI